MGKIKYYLHIIRGARFKKLFNVIDRAHEKSGKSKVFIFFDIINCAARYGAGYNDYLIFAFWDMNAAQRKTYVTRIRNKKIIMLVNNPEDSHIFDNKNEFDSRFRKYLGRDFIDMTSASKDEVMAFIKKYGTVFAKPQEGESGKGIEMLKSSDFSDFEAMYEYIAGKHFGVLEELLKQHEDINYLYPHSINSLRIVTLIANGEPDCVYATFKMGNKGKFVDNLENDGLCCPVDRKTGEITFNAHTSSLVVYDTHPYTHVKLKGYKIPYVPEAIELCKKAAMEVPSLRLIGWDVCITPDGPAIIEGNNYPGYDFWQLPEHTPDKIGLMPYYKEKIPELR